ncbi:hypothetical protein PUN28_017305 [Cardiocondyla obscurior]|uniref:Uncharacterized protein n=1 Tax=Cardiocondyla obscurior TaxID=286306 RepID=A0AAW2EQ67_9HYME
MLVLKRQTCHGFLSPGSRSLRNYTVDRGRFRFSHPFESKSRTDARRGARWDARRWKFGRSDGARSLLRVLVDTYAHRANLLLRAYIYMQRHKHPSHTPTHIKGHVYWRDASVQALIDNITTF